MDLSLRQRRKVSVFICIRTGIHHHRRNVDTLRYPSTDKMAWRRYPCHSDFDRRLTILRCGSSGVRLYVSENRRLLENQTL